MIKKINGDSQNVFLGIGFICSMGYWVCFSAASLVAIGCEYGDEMDLWEVEKVEMAACVVGRVRDCVRCSSTKDMLQLEEFNFGWHREFRVWYLGRVCAVSIKVAKRWMIASVSFAE